MFFRLDDGSSGVGVVERFVYRDEVFPPERCSGLEPRCAVRLEDEDERGDSEEDEEDGRRLLLRFVEET